MEEKKTLITPTVLRVITAIILTIYFVLASIGFAYFEKDLFLRVSFIIIFFACIFEIFVIQRILGFILLTLYITLYTIINILYSGQFSIWLVFLITVPIIASIISLWKKSNRLYWRKPDTLLWILILICLLEGLVVLNFLTLSPQVQAYLLLIIPLTAIEIYSDFREEKLSKIRILRFVIFILLTLGVIFLSTPTSFNLY